MLRWLASAALVLSLGLMLSPGPSAASAVCEGTTAAISVGSDTLYIDETGQPGGQKHLAFYLEGNARPGLQRGGDGVLSGQTFPFLFIGFCSDSMDPDARLYP